ncbi:hypothetical protein JMUB7504_27430 [Staphylococcus aureus]
MRINQGIHEKEWLRSTVINIADNGKKMIDTGLDGSRETNE